MKTLKVNDLPKLVQERVGFILYDDLLELVHFDPTKRADTFKNLIIKSLQEYAKYYPVRRYYMMNSNIGLSHTFTSNFDKYLSGEISEDEINLIPRGIYYIKGTLYTNAQWWKYDERTYTLKGKYAIGPGLISYFAEFPYVITKASDNYFTEDSYIYFMDEFEVDYITFLSFYVIRQIRNINLSVELNQQVNFLKNIDTIYSELSEAVDLLIDTRSHILEMWRK